MLTLPEEILLLALNDKTGTDTLGAYLNRALISAALMDLVLQRRIIRREQEPYAGMYHIADTMQRTNNAYLDHVLATIAAQPKSDRLHSFPTLTLLYLNRTNPLHPNVYAAPPEQRYLAAQDLLAKELLILRESRFLFLWEIGLPQSTRPTGELELRDRLRKGLPSGFLPSNERLRALLLLIKSLELIPDIWGQENVDAAEWRIAQLLRLTMESGSLLADARRYIITGIGEEDFSPLNLHIPIPDTI